MPSCVISLKQINRKELDEAFREFIEKQQAVAVKCPSCGAPYEPNPQKVCQYCDTALSFLRAVDYHTNITRVEFVVEDPRQTEFTVPVEGGALFVYRNGLLQSDDDYRASGPLLLFAYELDRGERLTFVCVSGPGVAVF